MNLFRSEGHAKTWIGYTPEAAGGLLPLATMMEIFSTPFFRERLNGRYISTMGALRAQHLKTLAKVTGNDPFWKVPAPKI